MKKCFSYIKTMVQSLELALDTSFKKDLNANKGVIYNPFFLLYIKIV